MKCLAVDSTGPRLSLALADGGRRWTARARTGRPHEEALAPVLEALLRKAGWKRQDIGLLAAASGPGSFTGVRVGMTFVSVLAGALGRPKAATSLFEAEAFLLAGKLQPRRPISVGVVHPASRGALFFQAFSLRPGAPPRSLGEPRWVPPHEWLPVFRRASAGGLLLLAGPAAAEAARALGRLRRRARVLDPAPLEPADLLAPALHRLGRGSPGEFAPLYLQPAYYERKTA